MSDDVASTWMQDAAPDCPVHRSMQSWLESSLRWFIDRFGPEVLDRDPVLPTAGFLTDKKYDGSSGHIEAIVRQLCDLMLVSRDRIKFELFDGSAEKREAAKRSGRTRAVGHFRLEDAESGLTSHFGFGIFAANAAMSLARLSKVRRIRLRAVVLLLARPESFPPVPQNSCQALRRLGNPGAPWPPYRRWPDAS